MVIVVQSVKAHLVGADILPYIAFRPCFFAVHRVCPKFGAQVVFGQIQRYGCVVAAVPRAGQRASPAAPLGKRHVLVLFQDVGGKAVAVCFGVDFGFGEQIDFTVCLFQRLADFFVQQQFAPLGDALLRGKRGMPQADLQAV